MLDELTPEQRFELYLYYATEPFGELRQDMRMGKLLQFYYDSKRGKKGKGLPIAEFVLYDDIRAAAREKGSGETDLLRALGG